MLKILNIILVYLCVSCSGPQTRFAAIGDTPYYESDSELQVVTDALNDIGNNDLPFVVHVGDIIRGSTSCSDRLFSLRADVFTRSPIPFLITIGDNEFNDCKEPLVARERFRRIILNNPPIQQMIKGTAFDSETIKVTRQSEMIENASWHYNNIKFIMLAFPDIPGIYRLKSLVLDEILKLNIQFLIKHFQLAKKNNRSAVVMIMHSNPVTCRLTVCSKFTDVIKNQVTLFRKPVLYLNGSIHEREFEGPGYMGLENLWHIRPGSEPEEAWPEIIFSKQSNQFSVKWHLKKLEDY